MNTEALEYRLSQLQAQIDRLERVNAALKQNIAEQQQDFQRMSRELVDLRQRAWTTTGTEFSRIVTIVPGSANPR